MTCLAHLALKAPRQGAFILSAAVRREPPPTPADWKALHGWQHLLEIPV